MEINSARMKKIKIFVIVTACIAVLVVAIGLSSLFESKTFDTTWTGNTYANIANGGITAADGDTLYVATSNYLYRITPDGTCTKLTDYTVTSMAIYDGYLYYTNYDDSQQIYRMDLDTLKDERISDIPGGYINIVDGVLYYASLNGPDYTGIYKIDLHKDGEFAPDRITKDWAKNLVYYNQRLYFINTADLQKLYSISLDGNNRDVSVGSGTSDFTFYEGKMYYCNVYGIYRCKPDGSSRAEISKIRASVLNIVDGYIYHCFLSESQSDAGQEFYRTKIDGSASEILTNDSASYICYANGYIYFESVYKSYDLYRISTDNKIFENVENHYKLS